VRPSNCILCVEDAKYSPSLVNFQVIVSCTSCMRWTSERNSQRVKSVECSPCTNHGISKFDWSKSSRQELSSPWMPPF
jgi:hypothetical protein